VTRDYRTPIHPAGGIAWTVATRLTTYTIDCGRTCPDDRPHPSQNQFRRGRGDDRVRRRRTGPTFRERCARRFFITKSVEDVMEEARVRKPLKGA